MVKKITTEIFTITIDPRLFLFLTYFCYKGIYVTHSLEIKSGCTIVIRMVPF